LSVEMLFEWLKVVGELSRSIDIWLSERLCPRPFVSDGVMFIATPRAGDVLNVPDVLVVVPLDNAAVLLDALMDVMGVVNVLNALVSVGLGVLNRGDALVDVLGVLVVVFGELVVVFGVLVADITDSILLKELMTESDVSHVLVVDSTEELDELVNVVTVLSCDGEPGIGLAGVLDKMGTTGELVEVMEVEVMYWCSCSIFACLSLGLRLFHGCCSVNFQCV